MKPDCPFCRIVGNPLSEKERILYLEDDFITMLVNSPSSRGHFIVFPKKHFSKLSEMGKQIVALILVAVRGAEKATAKLGAKAYTLKLNNQVYLLEDNPLHVGHIHMHVIPRYNSRENPELKIRKVSNKELEKIKKVVVD